MRGAPAAVQPPPEATAEELQASILSSLDALESLDAAEYGSICAKIAATTTRLRDAGAKEDVEKRRQHDIEREKRLVRGDADLLWADHARVFKSAARAAVKERTLLDVNAPRSSVPLRATNLSAEQRTALEDSMQRSRARRAARREQMQATPIAEIEARVEVEARAEVEARTQTMAAAHRMNRMKHRGGRIAAAAERAVVWRCATCGVVYELGVDACAPCAATTEEVFDAETGATTMVAASVVPTLKGLATQPPQSILSDVVIFNADAGASAWVSEGDEVQEEVVAAPSKSMLTNAQKVAWAEREVEAMSRRKQVSIYYLPLHVMPILTTCLAPPNIFAARRLPLRAASLRSTGRAQRRA